MIIRDTARLLVLDEQQRLLLIHVHDETALHEAYPDMTDYWVAPGGGVQPGESFEEAARRELWEETGLTTPALGPLVWLHDRVLRVPRGRLILRERFFLAPVTAAPLDISRLEAYERQIHRAYRWWPSAELAASAERFMPHGLPALLAPLLAGDLPAAPLVIGQPAHAGER